jgi:class 3 adenylate cyclase
MALRAGAQSPYAHGVAIGLDSGPMICGSVVSRVVSRLDYTVLGDVVNNAARLQQAQAAKGHILVSDAVQAQIANAFVTAPVGSLEAATGGSIPAHDVVRRLVETVTNPAAETVLMNTNGSAELQALLSAEATPG